MSEHDNEHSGQNSTARPQWLTFLETRMEEERDELASETLYYEIVRDMLLAESDPDKAIAQAIQRFYDNYATEYPKEFNTYMQEPPEYGAGYILNSISVIVFDTIAKMPFTDPKQDVLSGFLIGITKGAAKEFDEQDPKFVCYLWGLQAAATERWNWNRVDSMSSDREGPIVDEIIDLWLSTSALIAKLFKAGLLGEEGPRWISHDFERAFKTNTRGDVTKHPIRQAQILGTAIYVLIAGEAFAKEAKTTSEKRHYELNAEKWKFWASKLQEVAQVVGEDALGNLKQKAQEAHDKMVELYPEAFNSE
ncbi:hypothetical protein FSARC_2976 [Fusarium sarcochroum]|uniref:Uncharacterized protein n=1 Tax=Fusarium sarcochroum TaxID=1208366 RepID=A0A8H4U508_9HYPO|nr:hypothetical protein FSARC_2976 [Fusarium sarcochroum]